MIDLIVTNEMNNYYSVAVMLLLKAKMLVKRLMIAPGSVFCDYSSEEGVRFIKSLSYSHGNTEEGCQGFFPLP